MSAWLVGLVGFIYLAVCISLVSDRPGLALAFFGYALSNAGIVIDLMRGQ